MGMLSASMGCWDGDNNDGITVIDVTDLERPAYCFLSGSGTSKTGHHGVTPYTAREYLNGYYNVKEHEEASVAYHLDYKGRRRIRKIDGNTRKALQLMYTYNERPLITADMLRQVWPEEYFEDSKQSKEPIADAATDVDEVETVPPLTEITLENAVQQVVEGGDSVDLEQLPWLPGKAAQVVNVLREMEQFSESALPLLKRALEGMVTIQGSQVDLSRFPLFYDEVIELLSSCSSAVETLDLSFNANISTGDFPAIVAAAPNVRRLVLMGCEAVKEDEVFKLLRERRNELRTLESIIHPALLTIEKPNTYPCAFSYGAKRRSGRIAYTSIPLFTPAQIVQALCDLIPWKTLAGSPGPRPDGMFDGPASIERGLPMIGASALQAGARPSGTSFGQRPVVSVPLLTPSAPRGEKELWMFFFKFKWKFDEEDDEKSLGSFTRKRRHADSNGWAFLRLTASATREAADDSEHQWWERETPLKDEYIAKVYDLDGFLGCMEREGRPMPNEATVRELRERLNSTNPETNEKWVPFLSRLKLEEIEPRDYCQRMGIRYYGGGFPM